MNYWPQMAERRHDFHDTHNSKTQGSSELAHVSKSDIRRQGIAFKTCNGMSFRKDRMVLFSIFGVTNVPFPK